MRIRRGLRRNRRERSPVHVIRGEILHGFGSIDGAETDAIRGSTASATARSLAQERQP